jgi:hypothetical protein
MPIKPKRWAFTPVTGTATNIRTASGGTTGALVLNGALVVGGVLPKQELAYYLLFTTTADDSLRSVIIVGTDADGKAQTETLSLPNNSTAITVNAFRSVTSITLNAGGATAGNVSIGTSNATRAAVSPSMPLDIYCPDTVISSDVSGTINFTVQKCYEMQNRGETAVWKTAEAAGAIDVVTVLTSQVAAIRLLINSYTNTATIALNVSQASAFDLA